MKTYEDELRNKWDGINYHNGGALQINVEHPLDWYVMYASREHKSIIIISDIPADKIASSKSIEASCNLRKDGRYAISFTLVDKEQEDVFISMSSDIIEFSKSEQTPQDSLKRALQRYAAWMKLLDHKRNALLSQNEQKGLLAELLFLKNEIEKGVQPSEAISGWVGPDGADQDFLYTDGWHEVKATGVSSSQITISSVEQLDNTEDGELVIFRIDKCSPAHTNATTLYALVHELFCLMAANTTALDDFVLKLGAAGYIDTEEYNKQYFMVSAKQCYNVNETFPRILRDDLPDEIVNIEYLLDLPSLSLWKRQ